MKQVFHSLIFQLAIPNCNIEVEAMPNEHCKMGVSQFALLLMTSVAESVPFLSAPGFFPLLRLRL